MSNAVPEALLVRHICGFLLYLVLKDVDGSQDPLRGYRKLSPGSVELLLPRMELFTRHNGRAIRVSNCDWTLVCIGPEELGYRTAIVFGTSTYSAWVSAE